MRPDARTIAGFAAAYAASLAIALAALFLLGGYSDLMFSLALIVAIALIPLSAILVTLVQHRMARTADVAVAAEEDEEDAPPRDPLDFTFATWNGIDSRAAVARLSQHLDTIGMAHQFARGGIDVREADISWQIAPVIGQLRVTGWVEARDPALRAMVKDAVEEFLRDELGIALEKLAA